MAKHSLSVIDCEYVYPEFAAAYLIREGQKAIFIEANTAHAVPLMLGRLDEQGLKPNDVQYVIITHVHLDHAGGASELLKSCPNATLLAHPKAAIHMADPSKLVQSARKVYGEALFEKLYGNIEAIPVERIREIQDGEAVAFGSRTLQFFYTRGHANHHFCIFDSGTKGVFTGDSFGLAYPALQGKLRGESLFLFPSTSPTDFDPAEAKKTVHRIKAMAPEKVFLTHFGEVRDIEKAANQLLEHLSFHESLLGRALASDLSDEQLDSFCKVELEDYYRQYLSNRGADMDQDPWTLMAGDIALNSAGIAFAAKRGRRKLQPNQ